jgi:hypothetical protein
MLAYLVLISEEDTLMLSPTEGAKPVLGSI